MKKLIYLIVLIATLSLIITGCGIPVVPPIEQNEPGTLPNRNPDLYVGSGGYSTIQAAIDDAADSEIIEIESGTYAESLDISKNITLQGVFGGTVIIDTTSSSDYGLHVYGDYTVTLKNFTIIGPTSSINGYGIKVSGENAEIIIHDVTVIDSGRSGIDLNGVVFGDLKDITLTNNGGVGLALTDCDNITINNIHTSGNSWGGIGIYTKGASYTGGSSNIKLTGINSFGEFPFPGLYTEIENSSDPSSPYPITSLQIPVLDFGYLVGNNIVLKNFKAYYLDNTSAILIALTDPNNSYIIDRTDNTFLVASGMSIQAAIDAASSGDTINVAAGTYVEQIIIDKSINLQGEDRETTIIEYPPATVSDQYLVMVQADDVTITGFKLLGHFAAGNRAAYIVHSQGTGLIVENNEIQGHIGVFGNLIYGQIRNNIIGTNKKGIYVSGGNNFLIEGNTIEAAEGAGSYASNCGAIYMDNAINVIIQGNTMQDFSSSTDPSITAGRGIEGSHNSYITIFDNTFVNNRDAITMWIVTDIDIDKNTITDSKRYGINIKGQNIYITNNEITGSGDSGVNIAEFTMTTQNVNVNFNNIVGNTNYGIKNTWFGEVNAECNWWGDNNGPYHSTNSSGTGDKVSDNVDFDPWLGKELCALKVAIVALTINDFTKPKAWTDQKKALLDKIDDVCQQIDNGAYLGAINKLQHDVVKKLEKWIVESGELIGMVNAEIVILENFL